MKENIHNFWDKNWRKVAASFFAFIMIFQAMSGVMDIAAYELKKVKLAPTTGEYYNKSICSSNLSLNKESKTIEKTPVLQKEPVIDVKNTAYDERLEVKDKRTANTKTYEISKGNYVQVIHFDTIHKKEGKEFIDIDNTLENISKARSTPVYENKDGLYDFTLQDNTMTMINENKQVLSIVNDTANLSVSNTKENVLLYSEAYDNVDMEYRVNGNLVATNFYINGTTSQNEINFTIHKGSLKVKEEIDALEFLDAKDNVIFSYTKPVMYDASNEAKVPTFLYEEKKDTVHVTMSLDTEWLNDNQRTYPVVMNTKAADETKKVDVKSSYNRSLYPNTTSKYYDLFVGYENGDLSGTPSPLGITRSYMHVSNLGIEANQKIVSATLNLTKKVTRSNQWNTIEIGKTTGYVDPQSITWANKPSVTSISTTDIGAGVGIKSLDVTSYIEDIYKGENNTIELKATDESSAYLPNVFLNESSAADRPTILLHYRDDFDIDVNLPIDTFDSEMRLFSVFNRGFEAFSFDGIAKPETQVIFELVERGKDTVVQSETSKGNVDRYFIEPIYIAKYLEGTQKYPKGDVNYTTDYIYKERIPKFDTPYEYIVKVKNSSSISTKEFRTDSFIKYKVKAGDNLKNIASYYGLTIEEIKIDNNLTTNSIKEDDILLLRFKKNNDKVSKDVYTPPIRTVEYKAKYVDRGANCVGGICPVIDPVNSTTGNYYAEEKDFVIKDADTFDFLRYYNSTGPQLSNMFGNGFTTPIESYLSYDKKGNMLYFAGDGRIFEFKKNGTAFTARTQDKMDVSVHEEVVTIKDQKTEITYQFDVFGYLDTMTSKEGVVTKINYDTYGLITSIEVGEKVVSFSYHDTKLVKDITLPSGKKVSYKYDSNRNLIEFTDTMGYIKKYEYDNNNYLVSITDKNNVKATQNTYDRDGRIVQQIDGNGNISSLTYGDHKTTITKGDGSNEVYTFNDFYDTLSISQDGKVTSKNTYDANRNITTSTDEAGKVTSHTYDSNSNVINTEYPDGTNEEYKYDANNNVIYQKDKEGKVTKNTYSGNDLVSTQDSKKINVTYVYDDKRRVIKETDPFGVSKSYTYIGNMIASITYSNGLIETFEYDSTGNTLKESDNQGKSTTYVYNTNNEMTQKNYYDGTNEQWTYDNNGNIHIYKDRIGGMTTNTYDKNNNLLKSVNGNLTTSKTYNEINQLISETDEQGLTRTYKYDVFDNKVEETDAYGNTTKYQYDVDGNVIKEIDALGNATSTLYDGNKNIVSSTDKNGNTETKTYATSGQLISETDALGYVKTYTYNTKGRVIAVTDPYNYKSTYTYDIYGNQIEVKLEDKIIEQKEFDRYGREVYVQTTDTKTVTKYDTLDRIIEKTDARTGLTTYTTYDEFGNVIEEKDSEGLFTTYAYDNYNRKIKTTDGYGRLEEITYDIHDHAIETKAFDGTKTSTKYDAKGNVVETTDAVGKVTKSSYNALNKVIKEEAGAKTTETVYDGNGQIIEVKNSNNNTSIQTIYDNNGNVIESIDALGNRSKTKYDATNQVIETMDANDNSSLKEYDAYGNVTKETDALGNTKQKKYNIYGLVEMEVDERGFEIRYEYNDDLLVSKSTDSKGYSWQVEYNDKLQKSKEINANEGVTEYQYDAYGRETKVTLPSGKVTTKEYDVLGNVSKESSGKKTTENTYDKLGRLIETSINGIVQTKNEYNALNQMIKSYDANDNVSTFTYDTNNQIIRANEKGFNSEKEYDVDGNITKQIDNKTYSTENIYDSTNKLVETKVNGRTVVAKTYDASGNEISTIEQGVETKKTYDANKRVITVELPSTTMQDTFVAIQSMEYDASGNVLKVVDGNGNVEEKKYDANNNVIKEINKNGTINTYEYDGLNNLIKTQNHKDRYVSYTYDKDNQLILTDINGKYAKKEYDEDNHLLVEENENGYRTKYEYDSFGNKIKEIKPDGTQRNYTYDNLGNKLSENKNTFTYDERNNVVTATNKEGTVKNTYDAFNNKTSVIDTKDNKVTYIFNENNQVSMMKYGGKDVAYLYNDKGLLEVVKKDNSLVGNYEYNNRNEVIQVNQNSIITNKTYDAMGRVLSQKTIKEGTSVLEASYEYDANDNVIKEIIDGQINTYEYDAYDELSTSNKHMDNTLVKTTYRQDVFGNQVENSSSEGKKVFKYNDKNQVESMDTSKGIIKFSYDDNGNVSKKINNDGRVELYTYDDFNQLVQLDQEQYVHEYTYDAENERSKQVITDTKDYHYDQWYTYSKPLDVVGNEEINDTFKKLKEQAKKKEKNGNTCTSILSDKYDVEYYKEPEVTEYILDRNMEYTGVLQENDTIHVYGDTLLHSGEESIVTGWNDSVVAKVTTKEVKKIGYSDYGATKDIASGNGYNGEALDKTGLIYLRARYYDPSVARFIQIDNNYDGEKENIASQNKYVYTLNNPYKYVDRSGNEVDGGGHNERVDKPWLYMNDAEFARYCFNKPLSTIYSMDAQRAEKKRVEKVHQQIVKQYPNSRVEPNKPNANRNKLTNGKGQNKTSGKSGGSSTKKPIPKKAPPAPICPGKLAGTLDPKVLTINKLCDSIYVAYADKFKDKNKLNVIKQEINKVREAGLKNLDVNYVEEKCTAYRKKLELPPYTSSDGVSFLGRTIVSLENSTISSAFISDVSGIGTYTFTMNITEYSANGFGVQCEAIKFSASLPIFSTKNISVKLGLVLELVNISSSYTVGFITVALGFIIGIGIKGGFEYDEAESVFQLIAEVGLIFGVYMSLEFDVKEMLGF